MFTKLHSNIMMLVQSKRKAAMGILQEPHAVFKFFLQRLEARFPDFDIELVVVTHSGLSPREILELVFGMRARFLD